MPKQILVALCQGCDTFYPTDHVGQSCEYDDCFQPSTEFDTRPRSRVLVKRWMTLTECKTGDHPCNEFFDCHRYQSESDYHMWSVDDFDQRGEWDYAY